MDYKYEDSVESRPDLNNDEMTPLFLAVVEATEEAILNSLFKAQTTTGQKGRTKEALPIDKTLEIRVVCGSCLDSFEFYCSLFV